MANLGDVAISLGPVLVTGVGAWAALHYNKRAGLDQMKADERRLQIERQQQQRDRRAGSYHALLALLWRFSDASMCRPRFPLPQYRAWREEWRTEASGVTLLCSEESRAAVVALDRIVSEIHQHWYDRYGMAEDSFVPKEPLDATDERLLADLLAAREAVEIAMRTDLGSTEASVV
jgi:hypothetical protein